MDENVSMLESGEPTKNGEIILDDLHSNAKAQSETSRSEALAKIY